jgi:hypothetical protein
VLAAANDTEYGLAGAIWTENVGRARLVANELRAVQVWVSGSVLCGKKAKARYLARRLLPHYHWAWSVRSPRLRGPTPRFPA